MRRPNIERYTDYYRQAQREAQTRASRIDQQTEGFASLIWRAIENFARQGMREAAALSYYALFSLFPLVLLTIAFIGRIIGPAATENQVADVLGFFMPEDAAVELNNTIARFVEHGSSASIVAIVSLSWSALGLFSNLESALSRTFRDTRQRQWWKRRVIGLLMILALGILITANLTTSLLFSLLDLIFLNQDNVWLSIAGEFVPFGFGMGIFAMLYRWIPRNRVGWDAIWPASLLGAILWEAAKRIFSLYLGLLDNLSLVYGSITTVIIFMLWTFYTSCIILLCAEFCVSLSDWLEQRRRDKPELHEFATDYYERNLKLPANIPEQE